MYFRQKLVTQKSRAVRSASGFTLIELLMVIAVILILAGITFGISRGVQNSQARAKAKAELAIIAQGLEQFKSTYGDYPWLAETTNTGRANELLQALTGWKEMKKVGTADPSLAAVTNGPKKSFVDPSKLSLSADYPINGVPSASVYMLDPWGNPYVYVYNKGGSWDSFGYVLMSSGPDGNEDLTWSNVGNGVIDQSFRDRSTNVDNIYAGE